MTWKDVGEFQDEISYEAYVIVALLTGMQPSLDQQKAFDYVYELVMAEGGFNPQIAYELGSAIRSRSYLQGKGTLQ